MLTGKWKVEEYRCGAWYKDFNNSTNKFREKKIYPAAAITKTESNKNVIIKQEFCQNMTTDILVLMSSSSQDQFCAVFRKGNLKIQII